MFECGRPGRHGLWSAPRAASVARQDRTRLRSRQPQRIRHLPEAHRFGAGTTTLIWEACKGIAFIGGKGKLRQYCGDLRAHPFRQQPSAPSWTRMPSSAPRKAPPLGPNEHLHPAVGLGKRSRTNSAPRGTEGGDRPHFHRLQETAWRSPSPLSSRASAFPLHSAKVVGPLSATSRSTPLFRRLATLGFLIEYGREAALRLLRRCSSGVVAMRPLMVRLPRRTPAPRGAPGSGTVGGSSRHRKLP